MGTIANAKVTHYYNCYNGDFIGCLQFLFLLANIRNIYQIDNQSVVFLLSISRLVNNNIKVYQKII